MKDILKMIEEERARQAEKFDDQEPGCIGQLDDWKMLSVLTEEVGEVARDLNERGRDARLTDELVQVAAVAVKWLQIIKMRSDCRHGFDGMTES